MEKINYRALHVLREGIHSMELNDKGELITLLGWDGDNYTLPKQDISKLCTSSGYKFDICYIQMHHAAQQLGEHAQFSYLLIDDRVDILSSLHTYFSMNHQ